MLCFSLDKDLHGCRLLGPLANLRPASGYFPVAGNPTAVLDGNLSLAPEAETSYRNAVLIRRRLLYMVDDDCVHGPSGRHKFQTELFCERRESDCATRDATSPVLRDILPVQRWIRYPHRADTTFPPRGSPGEHRCRRHTCLRSGSSRWL